MKARWRTWVSISAAVCASAPGAVGVVHPTAYAAQPALSIGAQGTSVQQLQNMLATLGYLHGPADGAFGPVTRAAVMTFQRAHHLTADGIVGPQTWNALTQALGDSSSGRTASRGGGIALQTAGKTVDPGSTATPAYPGQALRVGSRGSAVTQVQQRLKALGYNVGTVDGVFGPQTASAVTAFQRANHLTADGIVGPATWQALFAGNALRGPGTPGVNSSNGSSAAITSRSGGTTSTGGTVTAGTGSGAPSTGASGVTGSGTTRGNAGSGGSPGGTSVDSSSSGSDATLDYVEWASPAAAPSNPLTQSDAGMRMSTDNAAEQKARLAPEAFVVQRSTQRIVDLPLDYFYETSRGTWMHRGVDFQGKPFTVPAGPPPSWAHPGELYVALDNGASPFYTDFYQIGTYSSSAPVAGSVQFAKPLYLGRYENPFRVVDLRTPAPQAVTALVIDQWLQTVKSPLAGLGQVFLDAQARYGVNAAYLAAHAFHETGNVNWWTSDSLPVTRNNLFGYQAYDNNTNAAAYFPSEAYAIAFEAWMVRYDYLEPGAIFGYPNRGTGNNNPTLDGMYYYATDRNWSSQVATYMSDLSSVAGVNASAYQAFRPGQSINDAAEQSPLMEPTYYLAGARAQITKNTVAWSDWQMRPELVVGARGPWVAEMQRLLSAAMQRDGVSVTVDGNFGLMTLQALKQFQASAGLVADGDCGPQTWRALTHASQLPLSASTPVTVDQVRVADGTLIYHVATEDGRSGWVDSGSIQLVNVYKLKFATYNAGYAYSDGQHSLRIGDEVVYDPARQLASVVDPSSRQVFTISVPAADMVQVTH